MFGRHLACSQGASQLKLEFGRRRSGSWNDPKICSHQPAAWARKWEKFKQVKHKSSPHLAGGALSVTNLVIKAFVSSRHHLLITGPSTSSGENEASGTRR